MFLKKVTKKEHWILNEKKLLNGNFKMWTFESWNEIEKLKCKCSKSCIEILILILGKMILHGFVCKLHSWYFANVTGTKMK